MSKEFGYYDIFAVFIPGAVTVIVFLLLQNDCKKEYFGEFLNISLGSSILIIISIYVLGEIIQAFGKLVECLFWIPFSGKPTTWISSEKRNKIICLIRTWNYKEQQDILPSSDLKLIRNWIGSNSTDFSKKSVSRCFNSIQNISFQLEENKKWITIMIAKANMFRGFLVMALLFLSPLSQYCNLHYTKTVVINLLAVLIISCFRYRYYSKIYAKKLYSSFIKEIKSKK